MQAMLMELLDLAEGDDEAAAIAKKWNVTYTPDPAAPAAAQRPIPARLQGHTRGEEVPPGE